MYGRHQKEHDKCLVKVLQKIEAAGITLNAEMLQFCAEKVTFLAHAIDGYMVYDQTLQRSKP